MGILVKIAQERRVMNTTATKILTSDDFLNLIEIDAFPDNPLFNEAKIVIIPHSYRDETIELIEIRNNRGLNLRVY